MYQLSFKKIRNKIDFVVFENKLQKQSDSNPPCAAKKIQRRQNQSHFAFLPK